MAPGISNMYDVAGNNNNNENFFDWVRDLNSNGLYIYQLNQVSWNLDIWEICIRNDTEQKIARGEGNSPIDAVRSAVINYLKNQVHTPADILYKTIYGEQKEQQKKINRKKERITLDDL